MVYADVKASVGTFGIILVCCLLVLGMSSNPGDLEDKLLLVFSLLLWYATFNTIPVANNLHIPRLGQDIISFFWAEAGCLTRYWVCIGEAAARLYWDFYFWVGDVLADVVAVGGPHKDGRTVLVLLIEFALFIWLPCI